MPLLEVAEGRYLAESNAILWYVAGGTSLAPESRIERAEALQWMFFEQHALEPNIGAAYFWLSLVKGGRDLQTHALEDWMERGYAALAGDGKSPQDPPVFRRRPAHGRRHRALWLHPCRRPLRLRPCDIPRDPRLVAAGSSRPPASSPWIGGPTAGVDEIAEHCRRSLRVAATKTPPPFRHFHCDAAPILPANTADTPKSVGDSLRA